ncbi:hypothetical protein P0252_18925 [Agrobacterium fabrum]|uniref:hypothetical protein n=1 Tax=Agrobacterium fabrum TaxID=1176649 RepID=UPI0023E14481|nr:hypothetical protein [Agrobacterium fabrum]WER18862.1 hypothetical protein P0252_18925 [Agrobacterium fabrum]
MERFLELARKYIVLALGSVASLFGVVGTGLGYVFAIEQARVERFETNMLSEYKAVATSKKNFYSVLDKFTAELYLSGKPDDALVSEMNQKILELHQSVDVFSVGLSADDRAKISAVKTALASMKTEIARAKSKADLPYIAGSQVQFETAYKAVTPIVERKIGIPNEMLSG